MSIDRHACSGRVENTASKIPTSSLGYTIAIRVDFAGVAIAPEKVLRTPEHCAETWEAVTFFFEAIIQAKEVTEYERELQAFVTLPRRRRMKCLVDWSSRDDLRAS